MKAYLIVFLATQVVIQSEENLSAIFNGQTQTLHQVKDEKGVIKAAWRWEAVSAVIEIKANHSGLIAPTPGAPLLS